MTKDQAQQLWPVIKAWSEGEDLQVCEFKYFEEQWKDFSPYVLSTHPPVPLSPDFGNPKLRWRIKPKVTDLKGSVADEIRGLDIMIRKDQSKLPVVSHELSAAYKRIEELEAQAVELCSVLRSVAGTYAKGSLVDKVIIRSECLKDVRYLRSGVTPERELDNQVVELERKLRCHESVIKAWKDNTAFADDGCNKCADRLHALESILAGCLGYLRIDITRDQYIEACKLLRKEPKCTAKLTSSKRRTKN